MDGRIPAVTKVGVVADVVVMGGTVDSVLAAALIKENMSHEWNHSGPQI